MQPRKKPESPILCIDVTGTVLSLSIKIAQKPYTLGSLGPRALRSESFEGKGKDSLSNFWSTSPN